MVVPLPIIVIAFVPIKYCLLSNLKNLGFALPTSITVKLLVISSVAKKNQPKTPEENKTKQRVAVHNGGKQARYQLSKNKCEHK